MSVYVSSNIYIIGNKCHRDELYKRLAKSNRDIKISVINKLPSQISNEQIDFQFSKIEKIEDKLFFQASANNLTALNLVIELSKLFPQLTFQLVYFIMEHPAAGCVIYKNDVNLGESQYSSDDPKFNIYKFAIHNDGSEEYEDYEWDYENLTIAMLREAKKGREFNYQAKIKRVQKNDEQNKKEAAFNFKQQILEINKSKYPEKAKQNKILKLIKYYSNSHVHRQAIDLDAIQKNILTPEIIIESILSNTDNIKRIPSYWKSEALFSKLLVRSKGQNFLGFPAYRKKQKNMHERTQIGSWKYVLCSR